MAKAKAKKAVSCYVRCSTAEQNDRLQRQAIRRWLKAEGIGQARWYADKATGRNGNRPQWKRLLKAVQQGEVGTVVCWKADRCSRSLRDASNLYADLIRRGVRFVSLTEGFDLGTPAGKAMAGMCATFAEYEWAIRRERQVAGIQAAKAAGKRWGGSRKGWSKISEADQRKMRNLYAKGVSKAALARQFGLTWPTVHKIVGKTRHNTPRTPVSAA